MSTEIRHQPTVLREGIERGDAETIISALAPGAALHSPAAGSLKFSGDQLRALFEATTAAYEDVTVRRDFGNESEWVIGFSARIGTQDFEETLMLSLDAEGKVTELRAAIRPLAGLAVVASEVGARIARRQSVPRSLAMRAMMAPLTQMARSGEGIGPKLLGTGKPDG